MKNTKKILLYAVTVWLAAVAVVNYGAGMADATESHLTATATTPCGATAGSIQIDAWATDHGSTATATDAYVLTGATYDNRLSADLRAAYSGHEFTAEGPHVAGTLRNVPPGPYTVAVTLKFFATGIVSTGIATVTVPTAEPCPSTTTEQTAPHQITTTTVAPTTTLPTTTTTVAPGPTTTLSPADTCRIYVVCATSTAPTISGRIVTTIDDTSSTTLPRTGTSGSPLAVIGAALILTGLLVLAARRRYWGAR